MIKLKGLLKQYLNNNIELEREAYVYFIQMGIYYKCNDHVFIDGIHSFNNLKVI